MAPYSPHIDTRRFAFKTAQGGIRYRIRLEIPRCEHSSSAQCRLLRIEHSYIKSRSAPTRFIFNYEVFLHLNANTPLRIASPEGTHLTRCTPHTLHVALEALNDTLSRRRPTNSRQPKGVYNCKWRVH